MRALTVRQCLAAGEMMDQPRHVRVQAFTNEQARKAEAAKELKAKQEREREAAEAANASKAANARIARSFEWLWAALGRGEGPEAEVRSRMLMRCAFPRSPPSMHQWVGPHWLRRFGGSSAARSCCC